MTKGFQPQYWAKETARPGAHSLTDVVLSVPKSIAHHTATIAQSGSGKSYFLGRLIEEILLKTRSRVLIMDPNSDFWKHLPSRSLKIIGNSGLSTGKWFLVDEPTQKDFLERWNKVTVRLHGEKEEPRTEFLPLQVDWLNFPVQTNSRRSRSDGYRVVMNSIIVIPLLIFSDNWRGKPKMKNG